MQQRRTIKVQLLKLRTMYMHRIQRRPTTCQLSTTYINSNSQRRNRQSPTKQPSIRVQPYKRLHQRQSSSSHTTPQRRHIRHTHVHFLQMLPGRLDQLLPIRRSSGSVSRYATPPLKHYHTFSTNSTTAVPYPLPLHYHTL